MSKLVNEQGNEYPIEGFAILGRNPNVEQFGGKANSIVVADSTKTMSKTHAALAIGGDGEVLVEDLESTNGTFIEGDSSVETQVFNGDPQVIPVGSRVRFGDVYFTLV
ncbi:hypothetical protein FACS1894125_6620 [Actinomycetota bacterium]|nr:hypothetical protein FACS1894125_6620 [Actinomycetota bacterium]